MMASTPPDPQSPATRFLLLRALSLPLPLPLPSRTPTPGPDASSSAAAATAAEALAASSKPTARITPGRRRRGGGTGTGTEAEDPDAPIHAATKQTIRRIVLTGAVALITVVGAITGARLKTDRDVVKKRQEVLELSLEDRIAMLESRRAELVGMKMPLERKLVGLRERMAAGEEERKA
ncbi:hypothetical protein N0V82_005529 [Gnomoniopsis sp. IMI 355080]|nr:hypothetical protein N0V82_005529 [Gnomoniopsis sp. IMI 355080]